MSEELTDRLAFELSSKVQVELHRMQKDTLCPADLIIIRNKAVPMFKTVAEGAAAQNYKAALSIRPWWKKALGIKPKKEHRTIQSLFRQAVVVQTNPCIGKADVEIVQLGHSIRVVKQEATGDFAVLRLELVDTVSEDRKREIYV